MAVAKKANPSTNGASLGYEAKLFQAADKMRSGVSPADYKHIALGLIFLKYISDAFEAKYAQLKADGEDTEDKDEYLAENVFWVPKEARWSYLQANAPQPKIGKLLDNAMLALEADNPSLKGVLPKEYAHPALSKTMLGELINLFGTIDVGGNIRVLNQKCIRDSVVSFSPARHHNHLSKPVKDRELIRGDILVNSTGVGTLGRVAQIWTLEEPTVVDSHVTVVRAKKTKITSTYLGLNLLTRQSEIEGLGEGSTGQTELNRGRLGNLNLTAPPLPLLERFENILTPFIDKMSCNQAENILLSSLRDTLLPKLISGELRIEHIKRNQGN